MAAAAEVTAAWHISAVYLFLDEAMQVELEHLPVTTAATPLVVEEGPVLLAGLPHLDNPVLEALVLHLQLLDRQ
jgi:hypothetical protein